MRRQVSRIPRPHSGLPLAPWTAAFFRGQHLPETSRRGCSLQPDNRPSLRARRVTLPAAPLPENRLVYHSSGRRDSTCWTGSPSPETPPLQVVHPLPKRAARQLVRYRYPSTAFRLVGNQPNLPLVGCPLPRCAAGGFRLFARAIFLPYRGRCSHARRTAPAA